MSASAKLWTGRVLSGLAILFLVFDGVMKFFMDKLPPEALEAGAVLQWPVEKMPLVGTILLVCVLLRGIVNRLSWRRHCQPRAGWHAVVFTHTVSGLYRDIGMVRPIFT